MSHQIQVRVETRYLSEQSAPSENRFVFAYTITVHNYRDAPAQLLSRRWLITHGNGKVEEVRGDGVVGKQPWVRPGDEFNYTSGVVLDTPVGTMSGSYHWIDEDGNRFETGIDPFTLSVPRTLH